MAKEKKAKSKKSAPKAAQILKPQKAAKPPKKPAKLKSAPPAVPAAAEKPIAAVAQPAKRGKYYEAVGRRKESVARVRLFTTESAITVNQKPVAEYFRVLELQKTAVVPIKTMHLEGRIGGTVVARGGGLRGQAEAMRLGIARALVKFNPDFQKRLKRVGFLTRDARVKERKKYGLKKARRAPQWQKR